MLEALEGEFARRPGHSDTGACVRDVRPDARNNPESRTERGTCSANARSSDAFFGTAQSSYYVYTDNSSTHTQTGQSRAAAVVRCMPMRDDPQNAVEVVLLSVSDTDVSSVTLLLIS